MFLDFTLVLSMGVLMFGFMVAQEDRDNEVDSIKSARSPDIPMGDGFMMEEQPTTPPHCAPNQTCYYLAYDHRGTYAHAKVFPCRVCDKDHWCKVAELDRPRCKLLFRCSPFTYLSDEEAKEMRRRNHHFIPMREVLLQDEYGRNVTELRHCPIYNFDKPLTEDDGFQTELYRE